MVVHSLFWIGFEIGCLGGAVTLWLVRLIPDRVVRVWALVGDIVLCSCSRHFTLIGHLACKQTVPTYLFWIC